MWPERYRKILIPLDAPQLEGDVGYRETRHMRSWSKYLV